MGGSREKKRGRKRRHYSPAFRLKAVKLYLQGGHSYHQRGQSIKMILVKSVGFFSRTFWAAKTFWRSGGYNHCGGL
jgi:hypothetical protein